MYDSLNSFIRRLDQSGELIRISAEVSPHLEIAELTDRQCKQPGGGKALLFDHPSLPFLVATNLMGSSRRMAMALGADSLDDITARLESFLGRLTSPKESFGDKLGMLPLMAQAARWTPSRLRGRGECQQVVLTGDDADLSKLPVPTWAPYDGGAFITLPLVHTLDAVSGAHNTGMYRMQIMGAQLTGMHWHLHKTGAAHYEQYRQAGRLMPVTVTLGGDPACTYAATAPLPEGVDEYLLAGFLRDKPVRLVKSLTNDIWIPADSDFVIEGYVDPSEAKVVEGPFGDHTGFYSLEDLYPLFHVTCITHRRDAVYPATLVGVPPMEDLYIAEATEKIFLPPIKAVIQPDIQALHMPSEGVAHNIAIADITARYKGAAFKVASSLWGAGQMMFNKFLLLTSGQGKGIESYDTLKPLLAAVNPDRDILLSRGPLDVLDHSADTFAFGGKMAIDATAPSAHDDREPFVRRMETGLPLLDDSLLTDGWPAVTGNLAHDADFAVTVERLAGTMSWGGVRAVLLFDKEVPLGDKNLLLWLAASNTDPIRDMLIREGVCFFDCRAKLGKKGFDRRWPNIVAMDNTTIEAIDSRWNEIMHGEPFIPSPSLRYKVVEQPFGAGSDPEKVKQ